jgi:hypothetical protein
LHREARVAHIDDAAQQDLVVPGQPHDLPQVHVLADRHDASRIRHEPLDERGQLVQLQARGLFSASISTASCIGGVRVVMRASGTSAATPPASPADGR